MRRTLGLLQHPLRALSAIDDAGATLHIDALKALLNLEATNSNIVKGGTMLAEARSAWRVLNGSR